jgi:RNA polymerase sigma factor (sigma-70 family)
MISQQKMYTKEEKIELILQYQKSNDPEDAEKILQGYYKLLIKVANSVKKSPGYRNNSMITVEDLVNNGIMGMYAGFHKIKTELGTNIDSYIMKWAREYMFRFAREMYGPVKVPVGKLNSSRKLDKLIYKNNGDVDDAIDEFYKDDSGTAKQLQKKKDKLKKLHTTKVSTHSIHTFENEEDGNEMEIKDMYNNGLQRCIRRETNGELNTIMNSSLTDTEKTVIERHFGINGFEKSTYEEIAQDLGVTRMRVCQITKKALNKMKRTAVDRGYNNNKYEV